MRILIADDSDLVRQGVKALLSAEKDCEVCGEAGNGETALEQARELQPDLVLLDISMPGPSGLEVARMMRDELPNIKILIMSQHDAAQLMPAVLEAKADSCVDKKHLATDLVAAIRSLSATSHL
jgi:DNA-binding NarL/FixJ family response regulator